MLNRRVPRERPHPQASDMGARCAKLHLGAVEDPKSRLAMVRKVRVDIGPASVLRRVETHHRVTVGRHASPVQLQVMSAAQRGGRLAGVDRYILAAAGTQLPEVGGGEARGRERGRGRFTDPERRGQDRIDVSADLDGTQPIIVPAGDRQDRPQRVVRHERVFALRRGLVYAPVGCIL